MTDIKNSAAASKKCKHTLEETERNIIRQLLITAGPWISSFQDFEQINFNRNQSKRIKKKKKNKKPFPLNWVIEIKRKCFSSGS